VDSKQKDLKAANKNSTRAKASGVKASGSPSCPVAARQLDSETKKAWKLITEAMPAGVIKEIDSLALYCLVRSWSVWRYWERKSTSPDTAEAYKASCMASSSLKSLLGLMGKFGMTPKDRRDLADPEQTAEGDPFAAFVSNLSSLSLPKRLN